MTDSNVSSPAAQCAEYIRDASSIAVLSGAGLSTSAGIPDFRGPEGIYRKSNISNPEQIFDINFFRRDPSLFYGFHRNFLKELARISPTVTHLFFASLEKEGKISGVITQNIDSLHQKAGAEKVYEIHGGVQNTYCLSCNTRYDLEEITEMLEASPEVPRCPSCGGLLKPDIVFFGESVKHLGTSEILARESDLFFVLGSSLTVTPAAFLPGMAGGKVVVVNKGEFSTAYLDPRKIALHVDADLDTFFQEVALELEISGTPLS